MIVALLAGCQEKKRESGTQDTESDSTTIAEETDTVVPRAADELFNDFIYLFAANKKVQLKRIDFPLTYTVNGKTKKIAKKEWKTDHLFMEEGFYTLIVDNEQQIEAVNDTLVDSAKIERIDLTGKKIKQLCFNRKKDGLWKLTCIHETGFGNNPNGSFLDFYTKFAVDDKFQSAHLEKEVEFTGPDPDDDFNSMTGYFTPETWEAFEPEMPAGVIYNMVFSTPDSMSNKKILVISGIANGLERRMTFNRKGGVWRLAKLNQW